MEDRIFYRLKFEKLGNMRYIGHLDLQTLFQRLTKMAKVPIAYSRGFNPHQLMSFALPLSLGMGSVSEYIDIELTEDCITLIDKFNAVMPDGLKVLADKKLLMSEKTGAALLEVANYEVKNIELDNKKIEEMLSSKEINITKTNKKGEEKTINIREQIFSLSYEDDCLKMTIAAGSKSNLKPELVANYLGVETPISNYLRVGLLTGEFKPLI